MNRPKRMTYKQTVRYIRTYHWHRGSL